MTPARSKSQSPASDEGTIAIMSNRGPHDFVWENGHWIARRATAGLTSMIEPLARQPNVAWFCCVSEPPGSEVERDALFTTAKDQIDPDLNVVPVPLPAEMYQEYYGEISNEVLWMLQHHLVGNVGYTALDAQRHRAWASYLEANRRMAEAVRALEIPVRAFLIQDYHLYPLPELLRRDFPNTPSLHFIHLPFPDHALLKLLPKSWREAILRGICGADVVGLQTPGDVRAFLTCCEEVLGATVDFHRRTVILPTGRTVRVRAFPASTDPEGLRRLQASDEVVAARDQLRGELRELNIARVDRLDPSKNQVLGFTAFGRLLEREPQLIGRVRFIAVLIPSRTDLTIYREYHDAVFAEIGRVNARFGEACGFEPIKVFYTNERAQIFAALELCDVLLVNSRQDGMNLVVKEWAVLAKKTSVLVLSEATGVAGEAGPSALLVSPLDIEGTAEALAQAFQLPPAERATRLADFRASIDKWTSSHWMDAQLKELGLEPLRKTPRPRIAPIEAHLPTHAGMVERELAVRNKQGIHARPAAAFVRCAREFAGTIEIVKEDEIYSAKSILAVLTANLNEGSTFILRADGKGAAEVVEQIAALLLQFQREDQ
jgi:trehalose 6-phosphate synthase